MTKAIPKKVVVIGGGTGTFVVVSGLKQVPNLDLTAIVTVADSGGSTGRLRDEFGFQPVGDLRQSLAALAQENNHSWIREVLLYRFAQGQGLKGHNLGNLILTALQDMAGSTPKALEIAAKIFRLEGHIYPITTSVVDLVVEYEDGHVIQGEHHLNPENSGGKRIKQIKLSPRAKIYSKAKQAISEADLIIVGPGDLYASILPNFVVSGAKSAIKNASVKVVYIVNLMTRFTQTHNYTAADHVREITRYMGRKPDHIIVNSAQIPSQIIKNYQAEHEYPVKDDLGQEKSIIRTDLVSVAKAPKQKGDALRRSLLRHNETKITQIITRLLK